MSARFRRGDKAQCVKTWTSHVIDTGGVYTVDETSIGGGKLLVNGEWVPAEYFVRLREHTEPEDATDAYVESEPLKEGDRAFNDDDVQHLKVTAGSTVIFDGLAVFEEADNGNVLVTPVPRCTSLFVKPGSPLSGIVRCGQHEGHGHGHWTIGSDPAMSWNDAMEYGRMVQSGGAS